LETNFLID